MRVRGVIVACGLLEQDKLAREEGSMGGCLCSIGVEVEGPQCLSKHPDAPDACSNRASSPMLYS